MAADTRLFLKVFSPRIMAKAVVLLDKSTAVVVGCCWLAALLTLILAVMAVHNAVSAKKEAANAITAEPVLPVATTTPVSAREAQPLMERLQRQFPDIKFTMDATQAITVRSDDGAKFHQWITALSYIDTMAPQLRWTMHDFCVGHCGQDLMKAVVTGQKVIFTLPAH